MNHAGAITLYTVSGVYVPHCECGWVGTRWTSRGKAIAAWRGHSGIRGPVTRGVHRVHKLCPDSI